MSASEKLKGLDEAMAPPFTPYHIAHWDKEGNTLAELAKPYLLLRVLLPQIVAVVEAAENSGKLAGSPLEAALSALEEALT